MLPKIARGFCNCTVKRTAEFRFRILSGKAQHHQGIFFGGVFFGEGLRKSLSRRKAFVRRSSADRRFGLIPDRARTVTHQCSALTFIKFYGTI